MDIVHDFDIARYARDASFQGDAVAVAVAVALAETGGDALATNVAGNWPPGSKDRGLWQINSYWHPEVTDRQAFDPASAAAAAYRISRGGQDWTPWATFVSGSYLRYMVRGQAAAHATGGPLFLGRLLRVEDPYLFGVDVATLQYCLGGLTLDGVFGPVTAARLGAWQEAHALTPDSIVGPKTCSALGWVWRG